MEGGLVSAVDVLAGVDTLGTDEELLVESVLSWVSEDDLGEWGSSSWVVSDLLDHSSDC